MKTTTIRLRPPTRPGAPARSGARSNESTPRGGLFRRRVPTKAVVAFTRSLAVMASARLPVLAALESAGAQSEAAALRPVLDAVRKDVQRGQSLSASLARHPAVFDGLYVQLVRVGEAAGILDVVLLRLATYLERTAALKRKVRLALVYPAVVLGVAAGAVAFMLAVIVPTFAEMFAEFGAQLPMPTQVLLSISTVLRTRLLLVVGVGALVAFAGRHWLRTPGGRAAWDRAQLRLPLVGGLLRQTLVARFCRTLGTLLGAGVPLVEALGLLARSAGNAHVEAAVREVAAVVTRGDRLSKRLAATGLFPAMVVQMITVGEETARLDEMLLHAAAHYEAEVDAVVEGLTAVVEPVLIVVIGLILGAILIALYLPMFDLVNVVGA